MAAARAASLGNHRAGRRRDSGGRSGDSRHRSAARHRAAGRRIGRRAADRGATALRRDDDASRRGDMAPARRRRVEWRSEADGTVHERAAAA